MPVVRLKRAEVPSAVLFPVYPPSGAGVTALSAGQSAKQANVMIRFIVFIIGLLLLWIDQICTIHYCPEQLNPFGPIELREIQETRERIAKTIVRTPLVRLRAWPKTKAAERKEKNCDK